MTPLQPVPGGYNEREVRELVARVIDGLLGPGPAVPPGEAEMPSTTTPPAPKGGAIAIATDHGAADRSQP